MDRTELIYAQKVVKKKKKKKKKNNINKTIHSISVLYAEVDGRFPKDI